MIDLSLFNFTHEEVRNYLHSAARKIDFRYELWTANGIYIKDLDTVENGTIDYDSEAAIKRTAKITMIEDPEVNYQYDRIKPFIRFFIDNRKMSKDFTAFLSPNFPAEFKKQMLGHSGWIEFPMGVFLLTSPTRTEQVKGFIRDIECYDGCLILQEDKFTERWFIPAGMSVRDAVIEILESSGITNYRIDESLKAVEDDLEFAIGDEKLAAVNQLLISGGYEELTTNANGDFVANIYINPADAEVDYYYKTDRESVVYGGYAEEQDFYHVPNKWVVTRSMADRPPLVSIYTNNNQDSPTSVQSRGNRVIVSTHSIDNIPDQQSLDLYTERIAFQESQVYGKVTFETAIMPFHSHRNILDIQFDGLQGNGRYQELQWSIPLEVGGRMKHTIRKVNPV